MSFRSALLASAAILVAGSAFAADLPARVAAPAPYIAAAPIFTWTGFYVGLNAGAGFNNKGNGVNYLNYGGGVPVAGAPGSFYGVTNGSNDAAFTGGAQAGYNMQFGAFVAGVEADINYIDRNKGSNGIIPNTVAAGTYYTVNRGNSSNYFGTVRGRLGYAFDRALIYVTGGLAYGGNGGSGTVYSNDVVTAPFAVTSTPVAYTGGNSSSIGWTLGGGLEYAFSNAWSVKAEYLHVDLGSNSRTFLTPVGGGATTAVVLRNENKFDIVRAGLNYRF